MSEAITVKPGAEPAAAKPASAGAAARGVALKTFALMVREGTIRLGDGGAQATISRAVMLGLFRPLLTQVRFDAEFYRRMNPDLARAEATGIIKNLHEHYLEFGYFEDRLPCAVEVDAAFYTREYPDVAASILERTVKSPQWHFESFGFKEGRLPRANWSFADLMIGAA